MPERECGAGARRAEDRLHRDLIGVEPLDDLANLPMEPVEAQHEGVTGRTPDNPEVHDAQPSVRFVHRAPAGDP